MMPRVIRDARRHAHGNARTPVARAAWQVEREIDDLVRRAHARRGTVAVEVSECFAGYRSSGG
jgi:hypothetical protein